MPTWAARRHLGRPLRSRFTEVLVRPGEGLGRRRRRAGSRRLDDGLRGTGGAHGARRISPPRTDRFPAQPGPRHGRGAALPRRLHQTCRVLEGHCSGQAQPLGRCTPRRPRRGRLAAVLHDQPRAGERRGRSENTAAWHQAMTGFLINRAATRAPRVNVIQILTRWTFTPQSGRHPQAEVADRALKPLHLRRLRQVARRDVVRVHRLRGGRALLRRRLLVFVPTTRDPSITHPRLYWILLVCANQAGDFVGESVAHA